MPRTILTGVITALAGLIAVSQQCLAQTYSQTLENGGSLPSQQPATPANSYALSSIEQYSPYTGAMSLRIPLHHIGGRGSVGYDILATIATHWSFTKSFDYYGNVTSVFANADTIPELSFTPLTVTSSSSVELGGDPCPAGSILQGQPNVIATLTRYQVTRNDNSTVTLRDQVLDGAPASPTTSACATTATTYDAHRGTSAVSRDGSHLLLQLNAPILDATTLAPSAPLNPVDGTLTEADGTTYYLSGGAVYLMEDRNGNQISLHNAPQNSIYSFNIIDPLNRQINIGSSVTGSTINYLGFGGQTRTISVNFKPLNNALRPDFSPNTLIFTDLGSASSGPGFVPYLYVISSIVFPDGSAYTFQYNPYGEIARVVLPTGGASEYDFGPGDPTITPAGGGGIIGNPQSSFPIMAYRRLTARRVYNDGTTLSGTTAYTWGPDPSNSLGLVTTETTTDSNGSAPFVRTTHFNTDPTLELNVTSTAYPDWRWGRPSKVEEGSPVLRTTVDNWQQGSPIAWCSLAAPCLYQPESDPQMYEEDVTLNDTGQQSKTVFGYDQYNNVTSKAEYDWGTGGAGSLLRTTTTTYMQSPYTGLHILGLPFEKQIFNGSGVLAADTQYSYDGATINPASNIVGHDNVNYAGNQLRGNATTIRSCANTANGCNWTSSTSTPATNLTYDIAGNVFTSSDPLGNTTHYTYGDPQNTYAHVTSATDAVGDGQSWTYDYYSGKLTLAKDQNQVPSQYVYSDSSGNLDPLDRVKSIIKAQNTGAEDTLNFYYTSPTQVDVYQGQLSSNDSYLHTAAFYDGFGRQVELRNYTGGSSYYSDPQTFDVLGRVATSTNEFGGTTQFQYDPLGRTKSVTTPDGAVSTTSYSGNVATVTDPASKQRQTTTDGVGRLTNVVEDPSGLNYSTTYQYDALDDLTSVSQSGQTRAFTYDSLKRLLTAQNPESGTVTYSYYANGNLQTRTDNTQRVTSYAYDQVNRLLSKTYPAGTPNVTYTYCNTSNCGIAYGVGHLQSVATSAGNAVSYTAYNAVGAVIGSTQTNGSSAYPFTYAYNPAGTLSQEQYPAGRQISYWYSAMNRPQALGGTVTDANGNATVTNYLYWTGYQGSHELWRALGPVSSIVAGIDYNSRGQVADFRLLDWNHSDNSPNYLQFYDGYYYGGTNNNGNLLSVTSYNSPSLQSSPWEQKSPGITTSYTYDGVNRLSAVTDSSYARTMCYDAYGNGWVTSYSGTTPVPGNAPQEIGGSCPVVGSSTPYNASNQLTAESYDGNGNQTTNSGNTVSYDAENRITSVSNGANVLVSYQYDGDGKRISKTNSGGTTNYVYDATGRLIAEYVNGSLSKEYIRMYSEFTPSNRDLLAIENAPGTSEPCQTCFVVSDLLGNIRIMEDNTGAAISRHDYLPFGEEANPDTNRPAAAGFFGADGATQRFTGKERDSESGLDYFGARYYGSGLGRFTSPDDGSDQHPQNPQSWNLYSYVRNNPLSDIDPDGHACTHSTGPNGESIVEDADGTGCAELRSNSVTVGAYDNAGIAMLAGLGDRFSGPNMAQFVSDAGRATASLIAPEASAISECVTPGGTCDKTNLAMAMLPIHITPGGLKHVLDRHAVGGLLTKGKSLFHAGEDIKTLITAADSVQAVKQANGNNFERVVDAGRTIGIDRATGAPTSIYTVITKPSGDLVTAFPGKP